MSRFKPIKKTALALLVLLASAVVFRGWIYRSAVVYKTIGERTQPSAASAPLAVFIEKNIAGKKCNSVAEAADLAQGITTAHLHFTTEKCEADPNKLLTTKAANCIGYAAFFTAVFEYLRVKYNLGDDWVAKCEIGHLYLFGKNMHPYFPGKFFKDHDFVLVTNRKTGQSFALDPSVSDYLFVDRVSVYVDH